MILKEKEQDHLQKALKSTRSGIESQGTTAVFSPMHYSKYSHLFFN